MGSGSVRKPTDKPLIRTPKGASGGASTDGSEKEHDVVAEVCLPSFDVEIKYDGRVGVPAILEAGHDVHHVTVEGKRVGLLSAEQSEMVTRCEKHGVVYTGKVIKDKDDTFYARFNRPST